MDAQDWSCLTDDGCAARGSRGGSAGAGGSRSMAPQEASNGRTDGGPPQALVVASDRGTQAVCRATLEDMAWEVVVVDSGVAAVVAARSAIPSVVFVDLQLRDVPGRDAIIWLRSNPEMWSVPIVVIAGGAEDDEEIATISPKTLLRKPVSRTAVQRVASELGH